MVVIVHSVGLSLDIINDSLTQSNENGDVDISVSRISSPMAVSFLYTYGLEEWMPVL
jgi:hypothetical protein